MRWMNPSLPLPPTAGPTRITLIGLRNQPVRTSWKQGAGWRRPACPAAWTHRCRCRFSVTKGVGIFGPLISAVRMASESALGSQSSLALPLEAACHPRCGPALPRASPARRLRVARTGCPITIVILVMNSQNRHPQARPAGPSNDLRQVFAALQSKPSRRWPLPRLTPVRIPPHR